MAEMSTCLDSSHVTILAVPLMLGIVEGRLNSIAVFDRVREDDAREEAN